MISEKTTLQEKFNKLPSAAVNKILKFNNDNNLEVVDISGQGILPQIKVLATAGYIVTCRKSSGGTIINASSNYPANTWYFNVPELAIYTISVKANASASESTYSQAVTEYKQYTVNAMPRGG